MSRKALIDDYNFPKRFPCILVTYEFEVGEAFLDAITKNDDARNKFVNFMAKGGFERVTFAKFSGPYVWVGVDEPHGKFISSHETISDMLAYYSKKMI